MKETLLNRNWYKYSQCSCGGTLRETWKSNRFPNWDVEVMPTKNTFILKRNNISKGSGKAESLEQKLKDNEIY